MRISFVDLSWELAGSLVTVSEFNDLIRKGRTVKQHLEGLDKNGTNPLVDKSAAIIESFESAEKDKIKLDKDTFSDKSKRKSAALRKRIEKTEALVATVEYVLVSTGDENNKPQH
jgi:hypothetical protein